MGGGRAFSQGKAQVTWLKWLGKRDKEGADCCRGAGLAQCPGQVSSCCRTGSVGAREEVGAAPARCHVRHASHRFPSQTQLVLAWGIEDLHRKGTALHPRWSREASAPKALLSEAGSTGDPCSAALGSRQALLFLLQDPACHPAGQLASTAGRR